jgi:hypothetical protein
MSWSSGEGNVCVGSERPDRLGCNPSINDAAQQGAEQQGYK